MLQDLARKEDGALAEYSTLLSDVAKADRAYSAALCQLVTLSMNGESEPCEGETLSLRGVSADGLKALCSERLEALTQAQLQLDALYESLPPVVTATPGPTAEPLPRL